MRVRFDDSLKTVLAADTSTAFGARAAYRQLVDLAARHRIDPDAALFDRLATLRTSVPAETRAAVARGMALADPPAALVAFLADDGPDVAAAVLRAVRLDPEGWEQVIPRVGPHGRSVLRRRGDLPPTALRALDAFGSTDFALPDARVAAPADAPAAPLYVPASVDDFAAIGVLAAAVMPRIDATRLTNDDDTGGARFEIAELVDRIAAFQRDRAVPAAAPVADTRVASFRFETDAAGIIRWIDSAPRGAVVGLSLDHAASVAPSVDGVAAGAFRKRASFADARLVVAGESPLSGDWRISGVPLFDHARGHFTGYRGSARRPFVEEDAARRRPRAPTREIDGLRRLVHELRTPANAISGFSELIEQQLLGPVASVYRERAADIHRRTDSLMDAIDDLETAARIEGGMLDLRQERVAVAPLLDRVAADLAPLSARRGASFDVGGGNDLSWAADAPAVERLVSRLLASVLSTAAAGEALAVRAAAGTGDTIHLSISRPAALRDRMSSELMAMDDERLDGDEGAPLLGVGFALRLARHLATELGGRLGFERDRLTLTLPAGSTVAMGQASTSKP
ncbi:hypothetical protein ASG29_13265 [Sphingomonas sp. Leaf412]|uniref:sensor histidine kinase n=1 Tax=Sphingomonas sp. Leaf412 TaxID=1736370 RepID=UPI0006F44F42|nr:HAMP domain-containing sensor histidine kinase [Sphingomonas sp. Leaf412]KQT32695.1 hypothetical protein ASG29_13265 [Sphingomonas sp. Leaf412]